MMCLCRGHLTHNSSLLSHGDLYFQSRVVFTFFQVKTQRPRLSPHTDEKRKNKCEGPTHVIHIT